MWESSQVISSPYISVNVPVRKIGTSLRMSTESPESPLLSAYTVGAGPKVLDGMNKNCRCSVVVLVAFISKPYLTGRCAGCARIADGDCVDARLSVLVLVSS